MREFDTGATRDNNEDKLNYAGFLSPQVLQRYAEYMHVHRIGSDNSLRPADNWKKGIPKEAYMESGFRHFMDWWMEHEGKPTNAGLEDALCALMFNVQGYLFEVINGR